MESGRVCGVSPRTRRPAAGPPESFYLLLSRGPSRRADTGSPIIIHICIPRNTRMCTRLVSLAYYTPDEIYRCNLLLYLRLKSMCTHGAAGYASTVYAHASDIIYTLALRTPPRICYFARGFTHIHARGDGRGRVLTGNVYCTLSRCLSRQAV